MPVLLNAKILAPLVVEGLMEMDLECDCCTVITKLSTQTVSWYSVLLVTS